MKKRVILIFIIILLLSTKAMAHQGKTDANGGHYNSATGEYHYHHGYPAHSHNGGCPYDYDDQTDHSSSGSQNNYDDTEDIIEFDDSSTNSKKNYNTPESISPSFDKEIQDISKDNKSSSYTTEIIFLSIAFVGLIVVIIFSTARYKSKKNENNCVYTPKVSAIPKTTEVSSTLKKRSIDIKSYHSSRTHTLSFKEQFKMDYTDFNLSTDCKKSIDEMIEKGHYKTAVLMLINLGIYKDYFYDMLDIQISKNDLKQYADYRAFINME